ncbi:MULTISPECIES: PucR family transcriptional regulator [Nocardiaceae]|uniref:PucR family transcriptional regulator n=1 Tax=Nocardiaceae TaxID=85025 RepID=UPI00068A3D5A|nr:MULTISPECIES: helix-turn-helix domain-containing protein [Rhodococcus]OZD65396.1 PucR family transcriptional regulator [Rhodococcus sp. 05-340-2]OZD86670.1 PucR family transcriptional regulator [Rhodococcus sp. 05-339-2]
MASRIVDTFPELGANGVYHELRRGCEAATMLGISLASGMPVSPLEELPALLSAPSELVSRGLGVDHMLRSIHIGHAVAVQALLAAVESNLPVEERFAEAGRLLTLLSAVAEQLDARLARRFEEVRAAWEASSTALRSRFVNDILRGGPVSMDQAERALGYDLASHHVGVVAWWGDSVDMTPNRMVDLVRTALITAGFGPVLTLPVGQRRVWAWGATQNMTVQPELPPSHRTTGVYLALGEGKSGVDGFRQTHRQAVEASRVATASSRGPRALTRFRDVDLVTMVSADPAAAWEFVNRELGELAATDEMTQTLRSTLKQYLEFDRSLQKTAHHMHIARGTVAHRVSRAERLRGRSVAERRMQLEAALSLIVDFPALLTNASPNGTRDQPL